MAELVVICTRLSRGSAPTHDARTLCALDAKGGGRSPAIIRKLSAKKFLGTATSAGWKATWWAWLTIFALISVSSSSSVVINQSLIGSDVAEAYRKLPRGVGREIGAVLVWEWLLVART